MTWSNSLIKIYVAGVWIVGVHSFILTDIGEKSKPNRIRMWGYGKRQPHPHYRYLMLLAHVFIANLTNRISRLCFCGSCKYMWFVCMYLPIRNQNQSKWKIRKWNCFHTNSCVRLGKWREKTSWKKFASCVCVCMSSIEQVEMFV